MSELSEKEIKRARLAADYCKFCHEYHQQKPVEDRLRSQVDDMFAFFQGMNLPFEGKGGFDFFMAEKCIKCFEADYQKPEVAEYLEKHLQEEQK